MSEEENAKKVSGRPAGTPEKVGQRTLTSSSFVPIVAPIRAPAKDLPKKNNNSATPSWYDSEKSPQTAELT